MNSEWRMREPCSRHMPSGYQAKPAKATRSHALGPENICIFRQSQGNFCRPQLREVQALQALPKSVLCALPASSALVVRSSFQSEAPKEQPLGFLRRRELPSAKLKAPKLISDLHKPCTMTGRTGFAASGLRFAVQNTPTSQSNSKSRREGQSAKKCSRSTA